MHIYTHIYLDLYIYIYMDIIILVHIDYVHSRFSTLSTHDVHNIGSTTCPSANHIVSTCTFVHFIDIYIYCIYRYIVYILCTIYRLYIICVLYIQYMHMHYKSCKLNIFLCVLTLIINIYIYIYSMPWTIYLYIAWIVYTI